MTGDAMAEQATASRPPGRARLTREQVLQAALDYVDSHGLEALSMNKLGAELGVKGMSLYTHVASKDALLDGIVEAMWAEVELPDTTSMTWPEAVRSYAHAWRDMVNRHPAAAPLLNRGLMPARFLEYLDACRQVLLSGGFTNSQAIQALHAVQVYVAGYTVAEVGWWIGDVEHRTPDDLTVLRRVTDLVPRDVPDHLLRLAVDFCCRTYESDGDQVDTFQSGLDLIVQGLEGLK
jgi:TetR/AcrR family tetracycline transcriptional repressor